MKLALLSRDVPGRVSLGRASKEPGLVAGRSEGGYGEVGIRAQSKKLVYVAAPPEGSRQARLSIWRQAPRGDEESVLRVGTAR